MPARGRGPRVKDGTEELPIQRVEVRFIGAPPVRRVERASVVSCEVLSLRATATLARARKRGSRCWGH